MEQLTPQNKHTYLTGIDNFIFLVLFLLKETPFFVGKKKTPKF